MANPFPFVSNSVLYASQLNGIGEVGTSFTPTWSSSGTQPVLGNGGISGRYVRVNKFVYVIMQLTIGSTTTVGTGNYFFSYPITAAAVSNFSVLNSSGLFYDNSTGNGYNMVATYNAGSTTTFRTAVYANTTQVFTLFSATAPVVPATNDDIFIAYVYEAA